MNEYNQLKMREQICLGLLKYLDDNCKDDERYPDAYAEYTRQLDSIRSKIKTYETIMMQKEAAIEKTKAGLKPTTTIVGLKTAKLFGKSENN